MTLEPSFGHTDGSGVRLLVDPSAGQTGVMVAFTDRVGGVSGAPYDSLNLALRVGDDRDAVLENRGRAAAAAHFDTDALALARQVHGADVIEVAPGSSGVVGEADGLIARAPGVVIGILTADCAPVLLHGDEGVAVLHAGWRGLVAGVVEEGIRALGGARRAWGGPAIRACCYEVGPEVVDAFEARGLPVSRRDRVEPATAAAAALRSAGVSSITVSEVCTSCDERYYSYRRDGVTGRQGAFIALLEQ
jgi:polyphenol oxidase